MALTFRYVNDLLALLFEKWDNARLNCCFLPKNTQKLKRISFMVVIRLARAGSKNRPYYNIVATDSRNRRDGRFIEKVGFYNPVANDKQETLRVAEDRLTYWLGVGAQMTDVVKRLTSK